ncbi:MAG: GtrA family protein [Halieaceae bacterium]|nr:GtrA family protein [Halieaceae bacterium]
MTAVKYFFVGGTSALIDWTIFTIFAYFAGFNYMLVSAGGFIVATFVNYFLSIRFVFKGSTRFGQRTKMAFVFIVSGIGLFVHQLVLYFFVDVIALNMLFSKVSATGLVFAWNFLARKHFIFAGMHTTRISE